MRSIVEVEIVDDVMLLVPVRVVLPPCRAKVLLFKFSVPLPAVMVLPLMVSAVKVPSEAEVAEKAVAVALPKLELAVAVMEVKDGLLDNVIWVEVPINTACPPEIERLEELTVKLPRVVVPRPPFETGNMPET